MLCDFAEFRGSNVNSENSLVNCAFPFSIEKAFDSFAEKSMPLPHQLTLKISQEKWKVILGQKLVQFAEKRP